MTITYSGVRADFALVAADGLTHSISKFGREVRRFHEKVTIHPELPIAVASSGIAELGEVYAIDRIRTLLELFAPGDVTLDGVRDMFRAQLLDLVRQQLAQVPAQLQHIDHVLHLHVAVWEAGQPRVGSLWLKQDAEVGDGGGLAPPDPLHPWFEAHAGPDWTCEQAMTREALTECIGNTFGQAILADAGMHAGVPLLVGGRIRLAIVDAQGAHLEELPIGDWPGASLHLPWLRSVGKMYACYGWQLAEMPAPEPGAPGIFCLPLARRAFVNPLLDDRLLVKHAIHELAGIALQDALESGQVPARVKEDLGRWQETLCRRLCLALDVTEYPFHEFLEPTPNELELLTTQLLVVGGLDQAQP